MEKPLTVSLTTPDQSTADVISDHDRYQHYFDKKDIEANLLDGNPMTALCGKVLTHQVDPKGRTICTKCQQIMEEIVGTNLPGRDGRDT